MRPCLDGGHVAAVGGRPRDNQQQQQQVPVLEQWSRRKAQQQQAAGAPSSAVAMGGNNPPVTHSTIFKLNLIFLSVPATVGRQHFGLLLSARLTDRSHNGSKSTKSATNGTSRAAPILPTGSNIHTSARGAFGGQSTGEQPTRAESATERGFLN